MVIVSHRTVVRRQEMTQKYVEKCEEVLSAKSEAKEALAKEVSVLYTATMKVDYAL